MSRSAVNKYKISGAHPQFALLFTVLIKHPAAAFEHIHDLGPLMGVRLHGKITPGLRIAGLYARPGGLKIQFAAVYAIFAHDALQLDPGLYSNTDRGPESQFSLTANFVSVKAAVQLGNLMEPFFILLEIKGRTSHQVMVDAFYALAFPFHEQKPPLSMAHPQRINDHALVVRSI